MNGPITHADFEELVLRQRLEPLSVEDARRLQAHLDSCERCQRWADALDSGLKALTSQPFAVRASVTAATRLRLQRRSVELAEAASRWRAVAAASLVAAILGLLTARALWLGINWLGQQWDVPLVGLVSLFVVVWFAPATLCGLAALAARPRQAGLSRALEEE